MFVYSKNQKSDSLNSMMDDSSDYEYKTLTTDTLDSDIDSLSEYDSCVSSVPVSRTQSPMVSRTDTPIDGNLMEGDIHENQETPWHLVTQKKYPSKSKNSNCKRNIFPTSANSVENQTRVVLNEFLDGKNFLCVIVHKDESVYDGPKGEQILMQDIVSLWNMPERKQTAFIILGIQEFPQRCAHGLRDKNDGKTDTYFQQLFEGGRFSEKPLFQYTTYPIQEKMCGLFTIPHINTRKSQPAISTLSDSDMDMLPNTMLVRKNGENKIADKQEQQHVFQWFKKPCSPHYSLSSKSKVEVQFLEALDYFDKRRSYACILNVPEYFDIQKMKFLADFPFVSVLDFHQDSQLNGPLSVCEQKLRNSCNLIIRTWKDSPSRLPRKSTYWLFPVGYNGSPDSLIDLSMPTRDWKRQVHSSLDAHLQSLAEFCINTHVLTVLIMWYDLGKPELSYLHQTLSSLDEQIQVKFVLCLPNEPQDQVSGETLSTLCRYFGVEPLYISLEQVCLLFTNSTSSNAGQEKRVFYLPLGDSQRKKTCISDKDVSWLASYLDVLYLDHHLTDFENNVNSEEFYRGAQLNWNGYSLSCFDATRTLQPAVLQNVENHVSKAKSALVNIFHSPGGGGTTFGLRVLWELHEKQACPCVYLSAPEVDAKEVIDRITWLYNETRLPIVLLVDGQNSQFVQQLFQACCYIRLVVIYIQRFNQNMESRKNKHDKMWLSGAVDEKEAQHLCLVFSSCSKIDTKKREALTILRSEVQNKVKHQLYEFGLTVHEREFMGLQKYVHGYLDLTSNDVLPWQKVVAYLSLALYYGHKSIPSQLFATTLNCSVTEPVTLENLGYKGQQFVLEDSSGYWRISHNVVAQEILEQFLSRRRSNRQNGLSKEAVRNLATLACEFIETAGQRKLKNNVSPPLVIGIVCSTFIQRNYRELSQDDNNVRRTKQKHSQLLTDMPESDRKKVLKKLTETFPSDALFWAHLGRFLAIKNAFSSKAVDCLEKALSLHPKNDAVLSQIHHMFGTVYKRRLFEKVDPTFPYKFTTNTEFNDLFKDFCFIARKAVHFFESCRKCHSDGLDESYGFTGEIEVRLRIVEFLKNCYTPENKLSGYYGYLRVGDECEDDFVFVKSCYPICEKLLQDCRDRVTHEYDTTAHAESDNENLQNLVNLFNLIFKDAAEALDAWEGDNIMNRRSKVIALIMKHHNLTKQSKNYLSTVDGIHVKKDIEHVILLLDKTIQEVKLQNLDVSITVEMKRWIRAIRHHLIDQLYNIHDDVLPKMKFWCDHQPNSVTATYYMYVLSVVCAIGKLGRPGGREFFVNSLKYRNKLGKMGKIIQYWKAWEWLGIDQGNGIRRLVNCAHLGDWDANNRFWKDSSKAEMLQVCRGTITSSSNPWKGTIDLDTFYPSNTEQIKVSFVPKLYNFYGKRFEHSRVEFFIGFVTQRGAEAYCVKELRRRPCPVCKKEVEVSSLSRQVTKCSIKGCNGVIQFCNPSQK